MSAGAARHPLSARGLKKSFSGVEAVRHFEHDLQPGIATGLIGPNGAGKTTIFNLLSGRIRPDEGEVLLNGVPITGRPVHTVSRLGLGRSFQEVRLFESLSCMDNCELYAQQGVANSLLGALLRPRASLLSARRARQSALQALEFVGLQEHADVPAGSLSYAEQKLLSIARLLALGARTLLLDEPASGLDKQGISVLVEAVRRLVEQGRTVMLIEHNLDVVKDACQSILFLDRGEVLAEGTPEDVFNRTELASLYFGG